MSRLKRVAAELADLGRHDLAREVALASLEFKQRTKLASGIDYMRESDELALRYCEEVAAKLAKELGGTVSRSNSEVLVLGPAHGSPTGSKKPFIKIFLEYKRLNFAFDDLQGHKDVLAFAATDSDAVVSKTVSALSKLGVLIGRIGV